MSAAARDHHALGAATEALIARAFAESALIYPQVAAKLVGVDEKTLREMADSGVIRFAIVGTSARRYTEADIRAFLAGERPEQKAQPCRSTSRAKGGSGISTLSRKGADILDLRAQRLARKRSGSKRQSVSQPQRAS